ncbi:MAG TPA: hypothetical protein PL091_14365 [Actinomycetota bacterium]|nr:hypothetical protein [Actinomycetota bacterium]HRV67433.1 hypothetical protein [Candidatus Nanopelagicales bacterium]
MTPARESVVALAAVVVAAIGCDSDGLGRAAVRRRPGRSLEQCRADVHGASFVAESFGALEPAEDLDSGDADAGAVSAGKR